MSQIPLFFSLGIAVGTLGTLIGAGGGFLLVPALLFLLPHQGPQQITAISLMVVACNSISGSLAYFFRGQIHLPSAVIFSLASIPGALIGARVVGHVSATHFELLFSALLLAMSGYLLFKKNFKNPAMTRTLELSPRTYWLGGTLSFVIAFMASFLGIGGGIVHVPLMTEGFGYPVHLATGTSNLILAFTASVASLQHWNLGHLNLNDPIVLPLAVGAILGAQGGAAISKRVRGPAILRLLGGALLVVALRLAWRNF